MSIQVVSMSTQVIKMRTQVRLICAVCVQTSTDSRPLPLNRLQAQE